MPGKRLIAVMALLGLMAAAPASAAPPVDREALIKALQNCPALQGNPQKLLQAMQNCPGLNGQLPGGKCPALNGGQIDPIALAQAAAKCPALNGPEGAKCPGLITGDPTKCPAAAAIKAPRGAQDAAPMAAKADKAMQRIVRALEQNKKSAEALIDAAKKAGADPNVVADLQKMSNAFRQVFMSTVSPQQIIESIFSRPAPEDNGGAIIITAPDGSRWLVAPQGVPPQIMGQPDVPAMTPPPPPGQQPGMIPPPPPGQQPGMTPPPSPGQQQGMTPPAPQQPSAAGDLIIMQNDPSGLPLWPTKDHLGKDGILEYLQKRAQMQQN